MAAADEERDRGYRGQAAIQHASQPLSTGGHGVGHGASGTASMGRAARVLARIGAASASAPAASSGLAKRGREVEMAAANGAKRAKTTPAPVSAAAAEEEEEELDGGSLAPPPVLPVASLPLARRSLSNRASPSPPWSQKPPSKSQPAPYPFDGACPSPPGPKAQGGRLLRHPE